MSPPFKRRPPSMIWNAPPIPPATPSSGASSKPNGNRLMPNCRSSTASLFPPAVVHADGHEPITVASRFGTLTLPRQVCQHQDTGTHVMPGNAVLPPHHGLIITRGLQEWACLLPQELSVAAVARLLGWQTHADKVLSDTTIRTIVRTHGQIIRHAEQTEVAALRQ